MDRINTSETDINLLGTKENSKNKWMRFFFYGINKKGEYNLPVLIFEIVVKLCIVAYAFDLAFVQFNTVETISSITLPYVDSNLPPRFSKTQIPQN